MRHGCHQDTKTNKTLVPLSSFQGRHLVELLGLARIGDGVEVLEFLSERWTRMESDFTGGHVVVHVQLSHEWLLVCMHECTTAQDMPSVRLPRPR